MTETKQNQIDRKTSKALIGGSIAEAIAAAAATVLAIIGLAGKMPESLMAVATIGLGLALLFKGAALSARFNSLVRDIGENGKAADEIGATASAESVGGLIGIVLGMLAILAIVPNLLVSAAVIIYGGVVIIGAATNSRLDHAQVADGSDNADVRKIAHEAVTSSNALLVLVGLAAIVLGIRSLSVGLPIQELPLTALLALSVGILLSGTSICGRMLSGLKL